MEDALRPGQAYRIVTNENVTAAEAVTVQNRRITVDEILTILNFSVNSAHNIVHDVQGLKKVSAKWVPLVYC